MMLEHENLFPFPVPSYRFDQRQEMFKRRIWDEKFIEPAKSLYSQVKYEDKYGYRKIDYALRNAAWHIEYGFAFGNMRGNDGLYSWNHVAEKARRFVQTGGPVTNTPEINSQIIKKAARFLGASLVGICYTHPNLVYSHEMDLVANVHKPVELPSGCTHAVVMAVAMDYPSTRYSPDSLAGASTGLGYSQQAVLANLMAVFIRGLGYRAVPSGNDTALSIPLAMAAGLGELGRNGLLITREFGPRVRICKVFTDLPMIHDDYRPFGVARFCRTCKKCVHHCPSKAISSDEPTPSGPSPSNHSGVTKWYINPEKCFMFWINNMMDCSNCIMSCPFNKPSGRLHQMARFFIRHLPFFDAWLVKFDDWLGYGKPLPLSKKDFWEVD